jgi:tetratricopeptide (TPR) repeat protein
MAGHVAACMVLLMQAACSHTPPTAIGPLVAPIARQTGPISPECPTWVKNCDKRSAAQLVGDVNDLGRLVQTADDLLFNGDEQAAWAQLNQALKIDSRHRPALFLMSQITDDPHKLLGELSEVYKPLPGETLRQIAAVRLGDARWCYALARYNGIAVPRTLEAGSSLRVPPLDARRPAQARSAPSPAAVPPVAAPAVVVTAPAVGPVGVSKLDLEGLPPTSVGLAAGGGAAKPATGTVEAGTARGDVASDAEQAFRRASAAEKSGKAELAYVHYMRAFTLGHAPSGERAAALRQELITRHKRTARVATERQDPDRAIKAWRNVLELDPQDSTASAELHKLLIRKDAPKAQ